METLDEGTSRERPNEDCKDSLPLLQNFASALVRSWTKDCLLHICGFSFKPCDYMDHRLLGQVGIKRKKMTKWIEEYLQEK